MDAICEFIPQDCRSRQVVVDVAAGTGLIGIEVLANQVIFTICVSVLVAYRRHI